MRLWDVLGLSPSRDKKTPNTERKKGEGKKGQQKKKKKLNGCLDIFPIFCF